MALFSKKQMLEIFCKTPADWIYLFASDSFIARLSGEYRSTVYKKNVLQRKYVNTCAVDSNEKFEDWRAKIGDSFKNIYGITPQEALNRLASGENVAGKNWKEGVYGIGKLYEAFSQNSTITVNADTGKLMQGGSELSGQTAVYSGNGKVVGYTVNIGGANYQSMKSGGQYYAGTYSTQEGAFNADGSIYQPQTSQSIFQSMTAWMPMIQQFVQWIMSLFNFQAIQPRQVVAQQSDWVKTKNDSDTWLWFIAGAGIIALLFGKK